MIVALRLSPGTEVGNLFSKYSKSIVVAGIFILINLLVILIILMIILLIIIKLLLLVLLY